MSVRKVIHCVLVNCGVVVGNGVYANVVAISNLRCHDVVHVFGVPCLGPEVMELFPCSLMVGDFAPFLELMGEEACAEDCHFP